MQDKADVFQLFKQLHSRQQCIQIYIENYFKEYYTTPTLKEIRAACDISSLSLISHHLNQLERGGWIAVEPVVARGIRILRWYTPQPLMWVAGHDKIDLLVEYLRVHLPEDLQREVAEGLAGNE